MSARAAAAEKNLPDGRPYLVPGPRIFYSVADDLLGASTRSNAGRVYTIEPKALSVNNSPTMGDAIDRLRAVRVAAEAAIASNSGTLTAVIDGAPVRLLDAALTTTGVVGWPAE